MKVGKDPSIGCEELEMKEEVSLISSDVHEASNQVLGMEVIESCNYDLLCDDVISYTIVKNDANKIDPHEEKSQVYHENPNEIREMEVIPYRLGHMNPFIQVQGYSYAMLWDPRYHVFGELLPPLVAISPSLIHG